MKFMFFHTCKPWRWLALSLSMLVAAVPAQAKTCAGTKCYKIGDTRESIQSGGLQRDYIAYVPSSYNGKIAVPLMLYLHGLNGTAQGMRDLPSQIAESEKRGFIIVFPQGFNGSWNGSACCGDAMAQNRDDVAFLRALIGEVKSRANIDDTRVYISGESNGAAMSHRFACEAADLIRAAVPMSHRLSTPERCRPSKPVTVVEIEGLLDPLVDYYGLNVFGWVSARDSFANWATINGCTGAPVRGTLPTNILLPATLPLPVPVTNPVPLPIAPPARISRVETFVNCAGGVKVGLVTVATGAHAADLNVEGFDSARYMWEHVLVF